MPLVSHGFVIEKAIRKARLVAGGIIPFARRTDVEKGPDLIATDYLSSINAAGTAVVDLLGLNANDEVVFSRQPANIPTYAKVSATLAEIKASKVIVAAVTGKKIRVLNFRITFTGNFATATSINLCDSATPTPVELVTIAIAQCQNGDIATELFHRTGAGVITGAVAANGVTVASLATGLTGALKIKDVAAGTAATGTSALVEVWYDLIN